MDDIISRAAAIEAMRRAKDKSELHRMLVQLPSAQPVEDARAMCGECDAWNKYKNYPQPEQFNPCTVCQEFDCTGCKFRRI